MNRASTSRSGRCVLPDDQWPTHLEQLWIDTHELVEKACREHGYPERIRVKVEELRLIYRGSHALNAPNFDDSETQLAYSAAYHPAHVFGYLHLLGRRGLGSRIFDDLPDSPKVMVLGAGIGAETIASLRWLAIRKHRCLREAQFTLVDRVNWAKVRGAVLLPLISDLANQNGLRFTQHSLDLTTTKGLDFVRTRAGTADLVFLPSILTEMISENSQERFLQTLEKALRPGAKVVLIDHDFPHLRHVALQWAHAFEVVGSAAHPEDGVVFPRPSKWVKEKLLDGAMNRIPVGSYRFMWEVLRKFEP